MTRTLVQGFLDPQKSLTQHYGVIQGISALGPSAVSPVQANLILYFSKILLTIFVLYQIRLLLLPNLETYMQLLEPELQLDKQKNEMKRKEAWRVYGALLVRLQVFNEYMLSIFMHQLLTCGMHFSVCCRKMLI